MAKKGTEVALSEDEAFLAAIMEEAVADAGHGNENVTSDDIAVPYISILQKGSPQCDEDHAKHIPGAKAGTIFNNVNGVVYPGRDEPMPVIPFAYERVIIEWVPRDAGGGMVAVHDKNTPLVKSAKPNDKNILTLPSGNQLIETAQHYMLYWDGERWEPCIISMKSTALKKSRLLNSLISQSTIPGTESPAPRWMFKWDLTTVLESKDDNTWYNFQFEKAGLVNAEEYARAKTMYESFKEGLVKGTETEEEMPF